MPILFYVIDNPGLDHAVANGLGGSVSRGILRMGLSDPEAQHDAPTDADAPPPPPPPPLVVAGGMLPSPSSPPPDQEDVAVAPPLPPAKGLVFDIGAAGGLDTLHYLDQGYEVIAVDARAGALELTESRVAQSLPAARGVRRLKTVHAAVMSDSEAIVRKAGVQFFVTQHLENSFAVAYEDMFFEKITGIEYVLTTTCGGLAMDAYNVHKQRVLSAMRVNQRNAWKGDSHPGEESTPAGVGRGLQDDRRDGVSVTSSHQSLRRKVHMKIDAEKSTKDCLKSLLSIPEAARPTTLSLEGNAADSLLTLRAMNYTHLKVFCIAWYLPVIVAAAGESLSGPLAKEAIVDVWLRGSPSNWMSLEVFGHLLHYSAEYRYREHFQCAHRGSDIYVTTPSELASSLQ